MSRKKDRIEKLLKILKANPSIHINRLRQFMQCSISTLRRDLLVLEKNGLIERSFGAVRLLNKNNIEYTWTYRSSQNANLKRVLCRKASKLISNNDAIFIDSSTICIYLINYLADRSRVKIITNNLKVASIAQSKLNLDAFLTGGAVRNLSQSIVGTEAIEFLQQFSTLYAFISCSSLDAKGLYMADLMQTQTKQMMISHTQKVVALVDHTKFLKEHNFIKMCPLDAIDYLITDQKIKDPKLAKALEQNQVKVIYS